MLGLLFHFRAPASQASQVQERVQGIMSTIFGASRTAIYSLDHATDLPEVLRPDHPLARVPFFALAEALHKVRSIGTRLAALRMPVRQARVSTARPRRQQTGVTLEPGPQELHDQRAELAAARQAAGERYGLHAELERSRTDHAYTLAELTSKLEECGREHLALAEKVGRSSVAGCRAPQSRLCR